MFINWTYIGVIFRIPFWLEWRIEERIFLRLLATHFKSTFVSTFCNWISLQFDTVAILLFFQQYTNGNKKNSITWVEFQKELITLTSSGIVKEWFLKNISPSPSLPQQESKFSYWKTTSISFLVRVLRHQNPFKMLDRI